MALFDLLGRTWAMGVLWNLGDGAAKFRELQQRCESISPTVLNRRLKELQAAQWIEKTDRGYDLTAGGRRLLDLLIPLGQWSKHWAADLKANQSTSSDEGADIEA